MKINITEKQFAGFFPKLRQDSPQGLVPVPISLHCHPLIPSVTLAPTPTLEHIWVQLTLVYCLATSVPFKPTLVYFLAALVPVLAIVYWIPVTQCLVQQTLFQEWIILECIIQDLVKQDYMIQSRDQIHPSYRQCL